MDYSRYQKLLIERKDRVLTVTLNRPEQLNATDKQMHTEISTIFGDIAIDEETDIVILTGAGKAFSAGGGYESMQESIDNPWRFDKLMIEAKRIVYSMIDCPKPIIAKVNGHAIGFGATLALYSDIVFMADRAKLADPHVKAGYVAGDGGAAIWPHRIGYTKAKEFLFTGDILTGAQAAEIGLINYALPLEELDAAVDAFVKKLQGGAPKAIQWTKIAINAGLKQIVHPVMETGMALEAISMRTHDHQEAVNALREKRPPVFKGR